MDWGWPRCACGRQAERTNHHCCRSQILSARRGGHPDRGCKQGEDRLWLGGEDEPGGAHPNDGQGRLRPGEDGHHSLLSKRHHEADASSITWSASASEAVRPGDSIPNKLMRPATPICTSASRQPTC